MDGMGERSGPYSRVYHSVIDDPKFETVYDDDHRLATWLRLLIAAEQAYPASAALPMTAHRASVKHLAEVGLIDHRPGSRFRLHGLDAERTWRSEAARVGGLASGRSRSVEHPLNERSRSEGTKSNLDEQRQDEQSRAEQSNADRDSLDRFYELTGSRPWGRSSGEWLKGMESEYGMDKVVAAMDAENAVSPERKTFLSRTEARLGKAQDQATTKVREERKAKPRPIPEWRKIAKEWAEWDGKQLEDEERERAGNGVSEVSEAEVDRGILPG